MLQQKIDSSVKTNKEDMINQEEKSISPLLKFNSSEKWLLDIKIGDLVEKVVAGATPKTSNLEYWENGAIPWLSSGEIHKKHIEYTDKYITKLGYDNSSTKMIPKHSVLIALAGQGKTRGTVAINNIELCTNQSVASMIPNEDKIYYKFLFYYLENQYDKLRALSSSDGGRGGLNLKLIKSFKINLPSINEQKKIANFISEIDKEIELLEKKYQKISILKNYYYSTMFNINTLDTLKIGYEELFLEDIVTKFSTGLNPRKNFKLNDGGDNFYVTIKNFENGILNLDDKCDKIDDIALNLINKRSDLKKDDLLFASIGRVGEVYLIKEDPVNWNINESVFSLRGNKKRVNPKFLYCLMKADKIQHYFDTHITGSTFKSIKMKDLRKTPITMPCDISEQEYIAEFLLKFDKKCYLVEKQIKCFNQFKKGLLQKMFI